MSSLELYFWGAGAGFYVAAATLGSGHAIFHQRDGRGALAWTGVIWLAPVLGVALYVIFGINRIHRKAAELRPGPRSPAASPGPAPQPPEAQAGIAAVLDRLCRFPRVEGNRFEPLVDGDQAFPAMLSAIDDARRSVALLTYIFDRDLVGRRFVDALAKAHGRGVEVRVLVDDAGLRYSRPSVLTDLRRRGVPHARFMPARLSRAQYVNLRIHRKIVVVDGTVGFTGGINLRHGHVLKEEPSKPVQDLHFRAEGPVVGQLLDVFREDWFFTTEEQLEGAAWAQAWQADGSGQARAIVDGPDEDWDKRRWALLAGLASAQRSVRILTPYFLPDEALLMGLCLAAHRGVDVDVLLPAKGNLPLVEWAMWGELRPVLDACRVWLTPPPFDHSKLMVVDDAWVLLGSGNWDPRSLRVNFELDVEVYDAAFARRMAEEIDRRRGRARRLTVEDWDGRSFGRRFRDAAARLLSPFL